jgi:hypothetical protein
MADFYTIRFEVRGMILLIFNLKIGNNNVPGTRKCDVEDKLTPIMPTFRNNA